MKVRAIKNGIYDDVLRKAGEEFDLVERVIQKKNPDTGVNEPHAMSTQEQFAETWMVRVHPSGHDREAARAQAKAEAKALIKAQMKAEILAKESARQAAQDKKDADADARSAQAEAQAEVEAELKAEAQANVKNDVEPDGDVEYESWTVDRLHDAVTTRGIDPKNDWLKHDYVLALKRHDKKNQ